MIRSIFSYSGDLISYGYSEENEYLSENLHNLVVFENIDIKFLDNVLSLFDFQKFKPQL